MRHFFTRPSIMISGFRSQALASLRAPIWFLACMLLALATTAQTQSDSVFSLLSLGRGIKHWSGGPMGPVQFIAAEGGLFVLESRSPQIANTLFRSLDGGRTWYPFPTPSGEPLWSLSSLYYDSTRHLIFWSSGGDLYALPPRGNEWTRVLGGFTQPFLTGTVSGDGKTWIQRGWDDSLHVSVDGGETWKTTVASTLVDEAPFASVSKILAAGACVYVGWTESVISVSCNGGVTWRKAGTEMASYGTKSMLLSEGAVIAAAHGGLVRSSDSGKTWVKWSGGLAQDSLVREMTASGASLFAYTDSNVYRSVTGGRSWSRLVTPIPGSFPTSELSALVDLEDTLFTVTRQFTLMKSSDGGQSWQVVPRRALPGGVQALIPQGPHMMALSESGVFVSADSGVVWDVVLPASETERWTTLTGEERGAGSQSFFAVGSNTGKVRVTGDGGASWSHPLPLPATGPVEGLAKLKGSLFAQSSGGLWRLSTTDSTWKIVSLPAFDSLRQMRSGSNALLLTATRHLWELKGDGSFVERNMGLDPATVRGLWSLGDVRYAYTSEGYLHRWSQETAAWQKASGPFDRHIIDLIGTGNTLFAVTYMGALRSQDGGLTWTAWGSAPNDIKTLALEGHCLYAGSEDGAILSLRLISDPLALRVERRFRTSARPSIRPSIRVDGRATRRPMRHSFF